MRQFINRQPLAFLRVTFNQEKLMTRKQRCFPFVFVTLVISSISVCGFSGCSSSNETTVITPAEDFQEDPNVAAEKAKAMAESQNEPL